jgi:hypothetical protein
VNPEEAKAFEAVAEWAGYSHPPTAATNPAGIRSAATAYVPDAETLGKVEAIASRLAEVTAARKQLEDEEKFLRQRLATLLPHGTTRAGSRSIQIRPNRRFDHETAMRVLTVIEVDMCSVTTVSAARAREVLPPERYAACQAEAGDPVVRVS